VVGVIDGMEATLLGDVVMYGRCVAVTTVVESQPGRQTRRAVRIDPECYQALADGRPVIEHVDRCTCDRPWHPATGLGPTKEAAAAPLPAKLEAELFDGTPTPTVLAALMRVRERRPAVVPQRITSLGIALLAEALLELGVKFPSQLAASEGAADVRPDAPG
jgi:hypothetical protein